MSALLDHLWQSSLFALICQLLAWAMRQHRAAIRYTLWFAAALKFLIPFSLLVALVSTMILPHTAPLITSPAIYHAQEFAQPFAVEMAEAVPAEPGGWDWTAFAAGLWLAGAAGILTLWLMHSRRLRRAMADGAQESLGLAVPVKFSDGAVEPGLVGVLRPVLLMPRNIAHWLSRKELDAVVAHELCHLQRRDNFTAAIYMLVEALFWFYPPVWWIGARLMREREAACDEAVLASGHDPHDYAQAIVKVCRHYVRSPLACASGISGADLKARIAAILASHPRLELSFTHSTGARLCEVQSDRPGELFCNPNHAQMTFETDRRGLVNAMLLHQSGEIVRLPRLDDRVGHDLMAAQEAERARRIRDNIPNPGAEDSLRRYILSLEAGKPNYQEMQVLPAAHVREELPDVLPRLKNWGALKDITFRHKDRYGNDIYTVHFANGSADWTIGPLDPDGKVNNRVMLPLLHFHFGSGIPD